MLMHAEPLFFQNEETFNHEAEGGNSLWLQSSQPLLIYSQARACSAGMKFLQSLSA